MSVGIISNAAICIRIPYIVKAFAGISMSKSGNKIMTCCALTVDQNYCSVAAIRALRATLLTKLPVSYVSKVSCTELKN